MSCVLPEIGSDSAKSCFWWFYFFLPGFWGIELGFWKLTGLRRWNVATELWRQPVLDTIRQNQGLPSQDLMVFQKVGKVYRVFSVFLVEAAGVDDSHLRLHSKMYHLYSICWVLGQGNWAKEVLRLALHRHLQCLRPCRPIWPGRPASRVHCLRWWVTTQGFHGDPEVQSGKTLKDAKRSKSMGWTSHQIIDHELDYLVGSVWILYKYFSNSHGLCSKWTHILICLEWVETINQIHILMTRARRCVYLYTYMIYVLTHPNTHPEVYEVYGGLLKLGLPQFIQVWTYFGFKPMVLEISF